MSREKDVSKETGKRAITVDRTLDILEILMMLDEPTITKIASHLELSKSTVHKHLHTLENRGYVVVDSYKYRPSSRFIEVDEALKDQWTIYRYGKDEIRGPAIEIDEAIWMMVEEKGKGIYP